MSKILCVRKHADPLQGQNIEYGVGTVYKILDKVA